MDLPFFESLPANRHRRIDTDKQEKGAVDQGIDSLIVPDIRGHPALPPMEGDKLQQRVNIIEYYIIT